MIDINAARERLTVATRELDALCAGKHPWTMRIPADEERDSDLVFARSLCDLKEALDELAGLRARRPYVFNGETPASISGGPVMVVQSFDHWTTPTQEQIDDAGAMPQFVADMLAEAQAGLGSTLSPGVVDPPVQRPPDGEGAHHTRGGNQP